MPQEMQTSAAASIASIEGTGGGGGDGDGDGDPDGEGPGGLGTGGADDGDLDGDGDTDLDDVTDGFLAQARGGSSAGGSSLGGGGTSADAAAEGPIQGSLAAQKLGPAGGPAGVVRALTVFLGLPLLVALGLASVVGGRALTVFSDGSGFRLPALLPSALSRKLAWRRAI